MRVSPRQALECRVVRHPDAAVVHIRGEVDVWTAEILREQVAQLGTAAPLVLDLREVTYLDGAGFRALVDLSQAYRQQDRHVCLIPSPIIRRLLTLLRLEDTFLVRDSLDDALVSVRSA